MNEQNKRIAQNTIYLYIRSILVLCVGLYTSRVVLKALGIDDYGIYNVVGGFVAMFAIISSSLVSASQRFISYEMGKVNPQMERIFHGTVTIHIILAIIILVLSESIGLWFLLTKLKIAPNRLDAAFWVYQFSIITFCINLISIPYNATIIAHERMKAFAYVSIFEACSKLIMAFLLQFVPCDRLIVYSLMMMLIAISIRCLYGYYCKTRFEECTFHISFDKKLFKEMLGFTSWNFIGSTASIFSTQGINVLVNLFFGVALNAARGVCDQVNNAINTFVSSFMTALNPQITKSYAAKDYDNMNKLMLRGAKYGTLMYWLISFIVFVESDFILKVWLVKVPPYAPVFLRLILIYSIFQAMSNTLYTGMLATGKIKKYQIIIGTITAMAFVICYIAFKIGLGPEWSYISMLISVFIAMFVRLKLLEGMIQGFSGILFFKKVIMRIFAIVTFSLMLVYVLKAAINVNEVAEFFIVVAYTLLVIPILSYYIGLNTKEKKYVLSKVVEIKNRI